MPDKIIQVDGVGQVAFPDSMKDEDIASVIKQQHPDIRPMGEQPASFGGVAKTMAGQAGSALSTAGSDIMGAPAAIYGAIRHPIDMLKAGISTPKPPQTPESQLPQDSFHRLQRRLGGGPNNLSPDNTPTSEVIGHGLALGAMGLAPRAIGKLPEATDAVMERVPQGFGINPDVRSGATKMAAGAAAAEALPGPLKWPARSIGVFGGARQMWRGLTNPDAAAQEAVVEIPTIKAPAATADTPAVFGDPDGFAKLPQSVRDAVLRGGHRETPTSPQPQAPRPPEHYGVQPKPETVDIGENIKGLRTQQGLSPNRGLGELPRGSYPERVGGDDSPTIRSIKPQTKFIKVDPESLGIHGGIEGTPIRGPLNTPDKVRIAQDLANELKKTSRKGGK